MRPRDLVLLSLAICLSHAALAGELEREVKGDWLGAWVVTGIESYSDCSGNYTNNRVNGPLVKSSGDHRFVPGELAKIDKLDVKRSRLDLLLSLQEPILIAYQEGPFTLYREAWCRVELEVEIPREVVKGKDAGAIETTLTRIVERYATVEQARESERWNERERDPFPDDYEQTLAALAVWRAEQTNRAVQTRLDEARDELGRLSDRMSAGPEYAAGLARGVENARASNLDGCSALLAADLSAIRHQGAEAAKRSEDEQGALEVRGYHDGRLLVYGLEMLRGLPGCFVPVPDDPAVAVATNE